MPHFRDGNVSALDLDIQLWGRGWILGWGVSYVHNREWSSGLEFGASGEI